VNAFTVWARSSQGNEGIAFPVNRSSITLLFLLPFKEKFVKNPYSFTNFPAFFQ
jgi:hypothetical protein